MVVFMLAVPFGEGAEVIEAGGPCPQHDARDGSRRGDGRRRARACRHCRGCGTRGAPRVEVVGGSRRRAGRPQIVQTIAAGTGAVTATPPRRIDSTASGVSLPSRRSFRTAAFRPPPARPRPQDARPPGLVPQDPQSGEKHRPAHDDEDPPEPCTAPSGIGVHLSIASRTARTSAARGEGGGSVRDGVGDDGGGGREAGSCPQRGHACCRATVSAPQPRRCGRSRCGSRWRLPFGRVVLTPVI